MPDNKKTVVKTIAADEFRGASLVGIDALRPDSAASDSAEAPVLKKPSSGESQSSSSGQADSGKDRT